MKKSKILVAITITFMIGTIAFMANKKVNEQDKAMVNPIKKKLDGKKVLVLYFSRAGDNYKVGKVKKGNTSFLAEYISEMTGADVFEITSKKDYDISYEAMLKVVREEWENNEYPEFSKSLHDIQKYDVIFVGGPIWWGTYPRVMFSFLKEHNLNGKIVIPFTTNEGSGLGNTLTDLQKMFPRAVVLDGFSISGQEARNPQTRNIVKQWLTTINYNDSTSFKEFHNIDRMISTTKMDTRLTTKGKECGQQSKKMLDIEFQDGHHEKIEFIVKGAVDMGLGTQWSATNLGADTPWENGNYYAWGETEAKNRYKEDNYFYYHQIIGHDISQTSYDAAQKQLGSNWRMPTKEEWHRLLFNTKHEWVSIQSRQGYLFTAQNGSHLFLPANGYIYDREIGTPNEGYYWTSTFSNVENAYVTYLPSNSWGISNYGRHIGIGIRPVK